MIALRTVTRHRSAVRSFMSLSGPSVSKLTVNVNFVDEDGYRATVPGRVGQTVHDVATMHGIDIGAQIVGAPMYKIHNERWTEDLFGEGPQLGHDHVMIPSNWAAKMPPRFEQEVRALKDNWDDEEINDSSRLASMIHLTKELDGIVVYMPDRVPDDCP